MARREFFIKTGDTGPPIEMVCRDADDAIVDISGSTARFHMKKRGSSETTVDDTATVVDGEAGLVRYNWQAADTDTAGEYLAEVEITFADDTVQTFPNRTDKNIQVHIGDQIA
jgi:hypothetical protein